MPGRYPFLGGATASLYAYSEGADNGYVWTECLDANGVTQQDSVLLTNGAEGTFAGHCATITAVQKAEFRHSLTANLGVSRVHTGSQTDSTAILNLSTARSS